MTSSKVYMRISLSYSIDTVQMLQINICMYKNNQKIISYIFVQSSISSSYMSPSSESLPSGFTPVRNLLRLSPPPLSALSTVAISALFLLTASCSHFLMVPDTLTTRTTAYRAPICVIYDSAAHAILTCSRATRTMPVEVAGEKYLTINVLPVAPAP